MRKNRRSIALAAMLVFYATALTVSAENLFFRGKPSKLNSWGQIKNIPEGSGEIKLENMELTIKAIKKPKDLKLMRVLKLKPGAKYVFKLIAQRTGEGKRRSGIYVLFRVDGEKEFKPLVKKKVGKTESPEEVVLEFTVPETKGILCINIYAPYDIGGAITISDPSVTEVVE